MLGMPRIKIEFEFDMVFCFGIRLALFAVFFVLFFFVLFRCCCCRCFLLLFFCVVVFALFCFFVRIYLHQIARPVESDCPVNIVFVRPSVLP